MKIFLDTADVSEIKKLAETGLIDGVTTNPTHLSKEGDDPTKLVKQICKLLPHGEISVEITKLDTQEVYKQAIAISKLSKNVLVKVPCYRDYYPVIAELVRKKVRVNVTLVFSVLQGLMMCKLGVRYISPFVGRLDDSKVDGAKVLYELRDMIDWYGFDTGILAASIRNGDRFKDAILAGADAVTVPVAVFDEATEHILTNKGMAKFSQDWKKLHIKRFP